MHWQAKHVTDRCDLGPAKGLDASELLSLASTGEISFNLPKKKNLSGGFGISGKTHYKRAISTHYKCRTLHTIADQQRIIGELLRAQYIN